MDDNEVGAAPQELRAPPFQSGQDAWQQVLRVISAEDDEDGRDPIGNLGLNQEHPDDVEEDGEQAPVERGHVPVHEGGRRRPRRLQPELVLPAGYSLIQKDDTSDFTPLATQHPFHQRPSPLNFDHMPTPLELFELFFTPEHINAIVAATNEYGPLPKPRCGPNARRWKPVEDKDIYDFLSCIIVMGFNHQPSLNDYWRSGFGFANQTISGTMTYRRFRQVGDMLCCPLEENCSDGVASFVLIQSPQFLLCLVDCALD